MPGCDRGMRGPSEALPRIVLVLLVFHCSPSLARVLARGTVAARKARKFVWARRAVRIGLLYDSGRIVLKKRKILYFFSKKKFHPMDGRFELLGYRRGKLVTSWHMDFPFLGRTAVYSRRDGRLMASLQGHVRSRATIVVPMVREWDKLEIRDSVSRRRTVLFVKRNGPMCRTPPRSSRGRTGKLVRTPRPRRSRHPRRSGHPDGREEGKH